MSGAKNEPRKGAGEARDDLDGVDGGILTLLTTGAGRKPKRTERSEPAAARKGEGAPRRATAERR